MTEEKKLIEVIDIEPVNKGAVLAKCSVRIIPWKMTLHNVTIFSKGENKWIGLPSREFTNAAGEKKYIEQVTFDSESVKNRFRNQIIAAFDQFLEANPDMEPAPLIVDEELPF